MFQQLAADLGVGGSGHRDDGGIDLSSEFGQCSKDGAAELRADRSRAPGVRVKDSRQIGAGGLFQHADMIPPEGAGADYRDSLDQKPRYHVRGIDKRKNYKVSITYSRFMTRTGVYANRLWG